MGMKGVMFRTGTFFRSQGENWETEMGLGKNANKIRGAALVGAIDKG